MAKNLATLLGGLLRTDVHPLDGAEPNALPADNPFVRIGALTYRDGPRGPDGARAVDRSGS